MSGTVPQSSVDLFSLGSTPPASPPNAGDIVLIGRPGANGGVGVPYAVSMATLAASLTSVNLPVVFVTAAGGTQATAAPLQAGVVNIVNSGAGGVVLPGTAQGLIVMNQTANPIEVYPPLNPNVPTFLNGQSANAPSPLNSGVEVTPRTQDGITWFVGS